MLPLSWILARGSSTFGAASEAMKYPVVWSDGSVSVYSFNEDYPASTAFSWDGARDHYHTQNHVGQSGDLAALMQDLGLRGWTASGDVERVDGKLIAFPIGFGEQKLRQVTAPAVIVCPGYVAVKLDRVHRYPAGGVLVDVGPVR